MTPTFRPNGQATGVFYEIFGEKWPRNIGMAFQWRHNEHDNISNQQPHDYLLNHLFRRRSKKISKLRVTGLCEGNTPETGEFPAQRASNAENVSIWWRHNGNVLSSKLDCDGDPLISFNSSELSIFVNCCIYEPYTIYFGIFGSGPSVLINLLLITLVQLTGR